MNDIEMTAEQHLAEVKRLATARLKACRLAATHERLTLVDNGRLAALEKLAEAVEKAAATARMTRDYKDVLELHKDEPYNGKRWLIRRDEFVAVMKSLRDLGRDSRLPAGCFAYDSDSTRTE